MSAPAPPVLTVRYDGSERTFAAGHDVVVGRDLRADMRITHPLISRAHLLLRFDQGRWLAIDNGSLNGTFVNGRRVPVVDIHDGQCLNIGNPDRDGMSAWNIFVARLATSGGLAAERLSSVCGDATPAILGCGGGKLGGGGAAGARPPPAYIGCPGGAGRGPGGPG
ncbi:FHA domain-containing protein, partial [Mycobacterium sp. E1715]|uniref:FHA domain-containing protein n=1 Tax=Mycobacterium sp. E1715 TaxID=1856863 RepID=UPI000A57E618